MKIRNYCCCLVVVSLFLSGCGGGNGGKASSGIKLSEKQVRDALNSVQEVFTEQRNQNLSSAVTNQSLLNFLRSRPEFSSSNISPQGTSVWARFKDGQELVIFTHKEPTHTSSLKIDKPNLNFRLPKEFPQSKQARVLNGFGNYFVHSSPYIRSLLRMSGYSVPEQNDATIDILKQVSNDGVFYIESHGGYEDNRFSIWTSTEDNDINDKKYFGYLHPFGSHRPILVHAMADQDIGDDGKPTQAYHYAITSDFIKDYMSFGGSNGGNSLVYFDGCHTYENQDFKDILRDKGASAYAGWYGEVWDDDRNRAAKFVFENLLGDGQNIGAVNLEKLRQKMSQNHYDQSTVKDSKRSDVGRISANFYIELRKDNFTQLAPSIDSATYNETKKQITINGSFGSNPGSNGMVTLGTATLPVVAPGWAATQIICSAAGINPGTYDLSVSVRGHNSNKISTTIPLVIAGYYEINFPTSLSSYYGKMGFYIDERGIITSGGGWDTQGVKYDLVSGGIDSNNIFNALASSSLSSDNKLYKIKFVGKFYVDNDGRKILSGKFSSQTYQGLVEGDFSN